MDSPTKRRMGLKDDNESFPHFDLEGLKDETFSLDVFAADTPRTDVSGETDFVKKFHKLEKAFHRKEDQDVAVFLALVDKMNVQSLLFILQGHARSMHNVHQGKLQEALNGMKTKKTDSKSGKKVQKKLRFAEIMGGEKVRVETKEIIHVNEISEEDKRIMWWSSREMRAMKQEAAKVVRFFRNHRPEYLASVSILCSLHEPGMNDQVIEKHMKKLTQNSFPRGLECHIVPNLKACKDAAVQTLLLEQQQFRADVYASDDWERIHAFWDEAGQKYAQACASCSAFSLKIAECDHVEALKASLSSWASKRPPSSSTQTAAASLSTQIPSSGRTISSVAT